MMKWIGVVLLVAGSGAVGFQLAAAQVKEERTLRQLITLLDYMSCELQYHLPALPELCRNTAVQASGSLAQFFLALAGEIDAQISPDVVRCLDAALQQTESIPGTTKEMLQLLGRTLGRFDLDGQVRGLESVRQECRRRLKELEHNRVNRLRSYQTLGLCAGAAMAILLL